MQDRYLRTEIFLAPFHALGEKSTLAIERDMELVEHLDRLNYHEAWIGEHTSGGRLPRRISRWRDLLFRGKLP